MASDLHRPTSLMVSASTRPQRRAMAPPARKDRAVTWLAGNPRLGSAAAEVWSVLVMRLDVTNISRVLHHTAHRGVSAVALCMRR
jgi:hypothetical protein